MKRRARGHGGPLALLLSCEHASDQVPAAYRSLFETPQAKSALASHRGIDFGAKQVGRFLAKEFNLTLIEGAMTRLVIDLNRSAHHPRLFSEFSKPLPESAKRTLRGVHHAYHARVTHAVQELSQKHSVLHIAVHSFTPRLDDIERTTDIGILFDPQRRPERDLARALQSQLRHSSELRVHRNAPYRGTADGLPTLLRKTFAEGVYSGIELEVNQKLLGSSSAQLSASKTQLSASKTQLSASQAQLSKLIARSIQQTLTQAAPRSRR